jgi:hypothetical protein
MRGILVNGINGRDTSIRCFEASFTRLNRDVVAR